jgi:hypothetical protein
MTGKIAFGPSVRCFVARKSLDDLPETFVSTSKTMNLVAKAVRAGSGSGRANSYSWWMCRWAFFVATCRSIGADGTRRCSR